MAFTSDQAELIGAELQSVMFGVYLVLFFATIYVLISRAKSQGGRANKTLLFGTVLLFCFVTAHWVLDMIRLWAAFIEEGDVPGGPLRFYRTLSDRRDVIRHAILVCEVITIDSLLLYRLFIIWNRDWRVTVLPTLTLIGTVVSLGKSCAEFETSPPDSDLWTLPVAKWIVAGFSLTLATNALAVALIAGRIMYRDRKLKRLGGGSLSSIATITIESAGVYCLFNLIIVITLVAKTPFDLTVRDMASPVTGISFCMITLRVGLGKSLAWLTQGIPPASPGAGKRGSGTTMPMQVRITHEEVSISDALGNKAVDNELDGEPYAPEPPAESKVGSWA